MPRRTTGLRLARRLGARHAHLERELRFGRLHRAGDRRGGLKVRRCGERNVTLGREQAGGRVEPDPAGAGQKHLRPGMQVGAVALGRAPVRRRNVGLELDQVARHETRRQLQMAQRLHQQPRAVAARAAAGLQRLLRRLRALFHPRHVLHGALRPIVQVDQELHRAGPAARDVGEKGLQPRPCGFGFEECRELAGLLVRQHERENWPRRAR